MLIRIVGVLILLYGVVLVMCRVYLLLASPYQGPHPKAYPSELARILFDGWIPVLVFFFCWSPLLEFHEVLGGFEKDTPFLQHLVYEGYPLALVVVGCLCLFL